MGQEQLPNAMSSKERSDNFQVVSIETQAIACLRRPVIVGARPVRPEALGPDEDGTAKAHSPAPRPLLYSLPTVRHTPRLCWPDSLGLVRIDQ